MAVRIDADEMGRAAAARNPAISPDAGAWAWKGVLGVWVHWCHLWPGRDRDDLFSVAALSYWQAAVTFRGDRGCRFRTWACQTAASRLSNWVRDESKRMGPAGATEPLRPVHEEHQPARLPDPDARLLARDALSRVERRLATALELTAQGYTQEEVSHVLGVSQGHVPKLLRRGREAARAALGGT